MIIIMRRSFSVILKILLLCIAGKVPPERNSQNTLFVLIILEQKRGRSYETAGFSLSCSACELTLITFIHLLMIEDIDAYQQVKVLAYF